MICFRRRMGWLMLLLACLSACQALDRKIESVPVVAIAPTVASALPADPRVVAEPASALHKIALDDHPAGLDWAAASDCRGKLALFREGLEEGGIVGLEDSPFSLMTDDPLDMRERWRAADGGLASSLAGQASSKPCVIRLGRARDLGSDHRVLGREQMRSSYQSGSRTEKNPAYDVAKARLRKAEKAAKPGKLSKAKFGDPLMDLVGTLVGGALSGLGNLGAGDELDDAMDELLATPRSIEKPRYKHYHFERMRVRAMREATSPITLTDRSLGKSWQVELRRREVRDLTVLDGLDPQDRNYASQQQGSLTDAAFRQWLTAPPALAVVDMIEGLLDRPSAVPLDRLALAALGMRQAGSGPIVDDASTDAAVLPRPRPSDAKPGGTDRWSPESGQLAGFIKVIGSTGQSNGVFVAPHFVLTPSEVIGARGLVDVEDRPGHRALGLVAAIDHGLGLALIQAPTPGRPVVVSSIADATERLPGTRPAWWNGIGRRATTSSSNGVEAAPLLHAGKLVGFRTANGPDIEGDAIRIFLDRQQHLLPSSDFSADVPSNQLRWPRHY